MILTAARPRPSSFLTLFPLLSLARDTFLVHPSELMTVKGAAVGDLTFFHWKKVFAGGLTSMNMFYRPLWNTLATSLGSCAIAILIGGSVAWLVTRSDVRWKPFISVVFIFPYVMPSWTLAMAWLNFFRNRLIGGAPGLFTALTGIETANWFAYGIFPIIVVQGLHYAPFAYILIGICGTWTPTSRRPRPYSRRAGPRSSSGSPSPS